MKIELMEDLIKFIVNACIQNKLVWSKSIGQRIMDSLYNVQNIKNDKRKLVSYINKINN